VRRHCIEPFFTTKGGQGAGLGLAVTHGLVGRHHGTMHIESRPGRGTTVSILLPVPTEDGADGLLPAANAALKDSLRVLVIDDEPGSRTLVERYLTADKHHVTSAASGVDGIDKFCSTDFDLVIVDRAMPQMSGDQVAAALREISEEVPVLMLTGFGDIMMEKGELPASVDLVVGKPLSRQQLRDAMVTAIQRAKTRSSASD
jgi:CheY-like chemotaxis protein